MKTRKECKKAGLDGARNVKPDWDRASRGRDWIFNK